jgi:hypothetical protein
MRRERFETHGLLQTREIRDRCNRLAQIGVQVEALAIIPGVPGQEIGARQFDVSIEVLAGVGKQIIEHLAHGENAWARVHAPSRNPHLADLAPGSRGALEDAHLEAGESQVHGGRESAYPCAYDGNTPTGEMCSNFD